ncbi:MAG: coproporphyrinogen dehydrogenase HemZ, partial [Ruminococcus sp.]|nr:coproporphyrinogen dehydrogenase HemZ [Ruminococcus sp.]
VILIGNSFKYEIEATLKMFFPALRFAFSDNIKDADAESCIIAGVNGSEIYTDVKINGVKYHSEKNIYSTDTKTVEHELCRLIYHILSESLDIISPWGLMTGIRPVKKVVELINQGKNFSEIQNILTEKYEISPQKLNLAYNTAVNQIPILEKINSKAVSLYISIPFCPTRCSYCSFVSHSMETAVKLIPEYVQALCRELEIIGNIVKETGTEIDTIYFGGGTPTSISADDIKTVMECVQDNFDLSKIREYSFEAGRPDTITTEKLHIIKELGAERISINTQTLNDEVLKIIGRQHTRNEFFKAFELARKTGFRNINTDLIAGLPTETTESFKNTLDRVTELSPENITVHTLTIKRAANLFGQNVQKNEDISVFEMVDYSVQKLMENGYMPYYLYR